ncbi:hypothetical protein SLS60_007550 [Paraconiothyrium brasiliense]|uniref:Uncharacterized protein n=1 Tax=Paraconiothyrium brasiliense TaxID=300254 RepID=A0ABR3R5Q4_9PLEO
MGFDDATWRMRLGTVEGGHHAWTRMGPHSSTSRKGTLRCYIDVMSKDNESVAVKPPEGQAKERPRWSQQHVVATLDIFRDSAKKATDTAMDGAKRVYAAHFKPMIPVNLMHQISFADINEWMTATRTPIKVDGYGLLTEENIQSLKTWKEETTSGGKKRKSSVLPKDGAAKRTKIRSSGQSPNNGDTKETPQSLPTGQSDEAILDALLTGRLGQEHTDWAHAATLLSAYLSRSSGLPLQVGEDFTKTVYEQLIYNGKPIKENPHILQLAEDVMLATGNPRLLSPWFPEEIASMRDSCQVQ